MVDRLVIRQFAPRDEGAVVALWEACGLTRSWNDPRKDIARKLRVQPEGFLLAVTGDEIVGSVMAGYDGHRGWVNYLAVAADARRAGVGRALMVEAERVLARARMPEGQPPDPRHERRGGRLLRGARLHGR